MHPPTAELVIRMFGIDMLQFCSAVAIAFLALPSLQQRSLLTNMSTSSVFPVWNKLEEASNFAAGALKNVPGHEAGQKNQKLLMRIADTIESWIQSLENEEGAGLKSVATLNGIKKKSRQLAHVNAQQITGKPRQR